MNTIKAIHLIKKGEEVMQKKFHKVLFFAVALLIGSFFMFSKAEAQVIPNEEPIIYGEFDLNSEEIINVIVEIDYPSIVEAKHNNRFQTEELLAAHRDNVIRNIESVVEEANVSFEYYYLFSGFALEIPANELMNVKDIPGIKAIYPNFHYNTVEINDILDEYEPTMTDSNPYVKAPEAWSMGYTGEGITVAVIDSGVDYNHPELAHAFGEYKGYDFVDNDDDPMEALDPSLPSPYCYLTFHGTHVTGTIVAQSFGIAPDAKILAYRVLGVGGGTSSNIIAAIERAVLDGADVMNLSLGNDLNSPDYATSIALDWAMAEGVIAATSSGNNGELGEWSVGSPGASRQAITVGSTALPYLDYHELSMETAFDYPYSTFKVMGYNNLDSLRALDGQTYEYEFVGLGYKEQFAQVDVKGKVALIQRGDITFVEKVQNAKDAGAVAAIIFNNQQGEINTSGDFALPVFQLDFYDGYNMYLELMYGFNEVTFHIDFTEYGETISLFSSQGPAFGTWMIKPDVVAPGDWIISTYPGGYYAYAGGTSMASPHVAAACALVLQAHPEYTPQDVKAALMNTAEQLIDPNTGKLYSYNAQGAGSIRIVDAIKAKTLVKPGSYSFGVFDKNKGKEVKNYKFEIKNLSDYRKNYTFKVEWEGNPTGIKVTTSNNTKVQPNSSQFINVNVQVDYKNIRPGKYEGSITVSDGFEKIIVPIILYVGEPDYPRVSLVGVQDNYDGTYLAYGYLLAGADYAEIGFFTFNEQDGTIGNYLGSPFYAYNLEPGFYIELWDGTINGYKLPPGIYVVAVYAEYKGVSTISAALFEIR